LAGRCLDRYRGKNQYDQTLAPAGKFRLLGVDTFDGPASDFLVGDFKDKAEAIAEAAKRAGPMLRMHVFDDQGQNVCDR